MDPKPAVAPESTDLWDVVVIGGAPPGENVAQYAIQGSTRTAVIVEKELVGGECSYWACMPSKALLRPWQVLDAARSTAGVTEIVGTSGLDVAAVLARRDSVVHHHNDSSQVDWATGAGIDVVRGYGRVAGEKAVEVTAADGSVRTLRARHAVVIDTGSTATVPNLPGLEAALPWTSRDVTNLQEVPARIAIMGGGVVACEAATWLQALGAEVTLIASSVLAREESFAGELVAQRFTELGIDLRLESRVERVERDEARSTGVGRIHGGPVTVHFSGPGGADSVQVDELLVAAGRTPASSDIGLETVGLAEKVSGNKGFVPVDDTLTALPDWLYAVGDVNGRALLTHMGKHQARIAGSVIAARAEGRALDGPLHADRSARAVPQVTFTDPEVGSVGLTEKAAQAAGLDVEVVDYDLAALAGTSVQRDDYRGRARIVVDKAADVIVGATFVGPEIADLVHAATVAIVGRIPVPDLWHAVPSYPTPSEIWLRFLETRYQV